MHKHWVQTCCLSCQHHMARLLRFHVWWSVGFSNVHRLGTISRRGEAVLIPAHDSKGPCQRSSNSKNKNDTSDSVEERLLVLRSLGFLRGHGFRFCEEKFQTEFRTCNTTRLFNRTFKPATGVAGRTFSPAPLPQSEYLWNTLTVMTSARVVLCWRLLSNVFSRVFCCCNLHQPEGLFACFCGTPMSLLTPLFELCLLENAGSSRGNPWNCGEGPLHCHSLHLPRNKLCRTTNERLPHAPFSPEMPLGGRLENCNQRHLTWLGQD